MKKTFILILTAVFLMSALPALAAGRTAFTLEEKDYFDITQPLKAILTTGEGFEGADILLDDTLLCSLSESGAGEWDMSIDISSAGYLGEAVLSAKAYYGDGTDVISKSVILTKLLEQESAFGEDFSGETTAGGLAITTNDNATFSKYTGDDDNKAVKITFDKKVAVSSPYLIKDSMGIAKGALIQIGFDVYFSTTDCYMVMETRDQNTAKSRYPQNGKESMASIRVFKSGGKIDGGNEYSAETWYSCRLDINTITKGLDIYLKGGDFEDWTLQNSYPEYVSVGLNQIRPCFYCTNESGGYILLDNVNVLVQSQVPQWYAKASFAAADGAALTSKSAAVEGGSAVIAFSKAMNEFKAGDITVVNASGDVIESEASYNSSDFTYIIAPKGKLCYNSEYKIVFAQGITASDNSEAFSGKSISFTTEKYPISVLSVSEGEGTVTVAFSGSEAANGEMAAVCRYDKDGAMTDFNMAAINAASIDFSVSSEGEKTVVYIIDSASGISVFEVYEK